MTVDGRPQMAGRVRPEPVGKAAGAVKPRFGRDILPIVLGGGRSKNGDEADQC